MPLATNLQQVSSIRLNMRSGQCFSPPPNLFIVFLNQTLKYSDGLDRVMTILWLLVRLFESDTLSKPPTVTLINHCVRLRALRTVDRTSLSSSTRCSFNQLPNRLENHNGTDPTRLKTGHQSLRPVPGRTATQASGRLTLARLVYHFAGARSSLSSRHRCRQVPKASHTVVL
jgi:hypothetical protein